MLNELKPSGAENMLCTAGGLWPEGLDCEILSTGVEIGSFAPALSAAGYKVHHLPRRSRVESLLAIWRLFRRFDVVHIHTEKANFTYGLMARAAGSRAVRTIHNAFNYTGPLRLIRLAQRALLRFLGVTQVAIGPTVANVEASVLANPTTVVPNWFNARRFMPPTPAQRAEARRSLGLPDHAVVLTVIGNCSPIKNHDALIRACARCVQAGADLHLLHAGTGPMESEEQAVAQALGLGNRVRFFGSVDEPEHLLHATDLYAMPSLKEGFSIAALEALGTGLPAVMPDVLGLRDLRSHSRAVVWASSPDDLALEQALRSSIDQLQSLRVVALADSRLVHERFGPRAGIAGYAAVYGFVRT